MDLTAFVDVAIGMTVVFLGTSLVVTIVNEYIAHLLRLRSRTLAQNLQELISDAGLRNTLRNSRALKDLFPAPGEAAKEKRARERRAPSYVDPKVLANALIAASSVVQGVAPVATAGVSQLRAAIGASQSPLAQKLASVYDTAEQAKRSFVDELAADLDQSLTMLGESYKRNVQVINLCVSFAVAVSLNVDSLAVIDHLYHDREARAAVAALGEKLAETTTSEKLTECAAARAKLEQPSATPAATPAPQNAPAAGDVAGADEKQVSKTACAEADELIRLVTGSDAAIRRLPLGWPIPEKVDEERATAGIWNAKDEKVTSVWQNALKHMLPWSDGWLGRIVSWSITAFSISLGSAFWFDALNRLVNVRHGMRKPEATTPT